jgi:3-oxoacyl-[acyl-carrier protein] reductase
MNLDLTDRVVFIAGASRGIGLGIVEACLADGAKVAMTARGAADLEATHARLAAQYGADKLWSMAGDMRDADTIDDAVSRVEAEFGAIYGAVANVGLHPCPNGFDIDDATWDAGFSQNLDSAYRLARSVLKPMTQRGEGSVRSCAGSSAKCPCAASADPTKSDQPQRF